MKKKLKSHLRKMAVKYLGLTSNVPSTVRVVNPDLDYRLDYRLVFGSVAVVRNPTDIDYQGNPRWLGPVEIQGGNAQTRTYVTSFGDFCDARILTPKEKDRHASYWKHSVRLVDEG